MKSKKIEIYCFGECGAMDNLNPLHILTKPYAAEILYLIAANEQVSLEYIEKKLSLPQNSCREIISLFKQTNTITDINNRYRINFSVFLKSDLPLLDSFSRNVAKVLGDKIISLRSSIDKILMKLNSSKIYSTERLCYHIIGDYIFDNTALDLFAEKKLISISKKQPGDRDYILIGYELDPDVAEKSNKLLCSSNNYVVGRYRFNSFGDSQGLRKDMFRFFRRIESAINKATEHPELNVCYNRINKIKNQDIIQKCGDLLINIYENKIFLNDISEYEIPYFEFLKDLGYLNITSNNLITCHIPIFEEKDIIIFDEISKIVLDLIFDNVKAILSEFKNTMPTLTSIRHGVEHKEIANELWHQIFGFTNEYLIKQKFYQQPELINGEGRYFQSLYIEP